MKKTLNLEVGFILLCLLYAFFASPAHCGAAETTKQEIVISAQELATLEAELQTAQTAIQSCKNNSAELNKQLAASLTALSEAKQQLKTLQAQLQAQETTLTQQSEQLKIANKSLQELSNAMQSRERTLERQRNIAYIVAAGLLYAAVK
ncbi:MAG: hypothetical protein DBY32_04175 [Phascolarctobacterium sp.]|nr:MAG: hypothetical protein DBY32_04175 [Phascolarctobacterium sp.]